MTEDIQRNALLLAKSEIIQMRPYLSLEYDMSAVDRTLQNVETALGMESPEPTPTEESYYNLRAFFSQEIVDLAQLIRLQSGGHVRHQLLTLPEQIKSQSQKVADLTADIEKLRLSIANIKNQHLEIVLSATENNKPKYSNEQTRKIAVEQLLREDKLYLDNTDELGRTETALRSEQIQLEYLQNMFLAYRSVANMHEVR